MFIFNIMNIYYDILSIQIVESRDSAMQLQLRRMWQGRLKRHFPTGCLHGRSTNLLILFRCRLTSARCMGVCFEGFRGSLAGLKARNERAGHRSHNIIIRKWGARKTLQMYSISNFQKFWLRVVPEVLGGSKNEIQSDFSRFFSCQVRLKSDPFTGPLKRGIFCEV